MNTNLPTIDSLFTTTTIASAAPPASKPSAIDKNQHFPTGSEDNSTPVAGPETTKTDNAHPNTHETPFNEPAEGFSHTLRKKIEPQKQQKSQEKAKNEAKSSTSVTNPTANSQQSEACEKKATAAAEVGNGLAHAAEVAKGLAPGTPVGDDLIPSALVRNGLIAVKNPNQQQASSKTPDKPTQPNTIAQPNKVQQIPTQAPNSVTVTSAETSPEAPQTENKSILPTNQSQTEIIKDIVPNITKGSVVTGTKQGKSNNADVAPILNKSAGETTVIPIRQNSQNLMSEAALATNKTPSADEKPAIPDKTPASNPVSNPVSNAPKNPVLNTDTPQARNNRSEPQPQPVDVGPVKSTATAEEPAGNGNKDVAGQILSELSGNSDKESRPTWKNFSGENPLGKPNLTEIQISAGQTKKTSNTTSENSSNSDFEQLLPQNNTQPLIAEALSASAETVKTGGGASPGNASTGISEQILESVQSSISQPAGNQQITIRLNPPELGKVLIKFEEQDGQITGLLEVSKTQTRYEVEQALPEIIRSIQDSGVQIRRLEVVLTDQSEQNASKDQTLQDNFLQQHGFAEGGNRDNPDATGFDQWLTNNSGYQDNLEQQEMVLTDNRIDMLM